MTKFYKAPAEVRKVVKRIRRKFYEKLADVRIITLMREGKWNKYGTIVKVSAKMRKAGIEGDYILTINSEAWASFEGKQKRALVDHELAHIVVSVDRKGAVQYKLKPHDVEEFIHIVKRYGSWTGGLKKMKSAMLGESD